MPLMFKMIAAAAALSSAFMLSARLDPMPAPPVAAVEGPGKFDDRWFGSTHALLLAAVSSRGIPTPPPAAEKTVGRVKVPVATPDDIEQFKAEKPRRARAEHRKAMREEICAFGKRHFYIGRHKYWRCKRRA